MISIKTDVHDGGVYVQPFYEPDRGPLVGYHVYVYTEADDVGDTMTADDDQGDSYMATVKPRYTPGTRDVEMGRAVFTVDPGLVLTTTNTDPTVNADCPAA